MGQPLDTTIRKKALALSALKDAMGLAEFFGMTHEEELERVSKAFAILGKSPSWAKSYLSGFMAARSEGRYNSGKLVFAHVSPKGGLYTAHKGAKKPFKSSKPIYAKDKGGEMSKWPSGHFWAHNGKPFFIGSGAERAKTPAQRKALGMA